MIKRLIVAAAGYALYRWWNSEPAKQEPALLPKPTRTPSKPAQPV